MAKHGGYRPGSGRPKGSKNKKSNKAKINKAEPSNTDNGAFENLSPLDYMLKVMRDPDADEARRDKMAISACQYLHPKGDRNKKAETKARAKKAASGKFGPGKPPVVLPFNRNRDKHEN